MIEKTSIKRWTVILALFAWVFIALATSIIVWESNTYILSNLVAILNVLTNGFGIYLALKKFKPME